MTVSACLSCSDDSTYDGVSRACACRRYDNVRAFPSMFGSVWSRRSFAGYVSSDCQDSGFCLGVSESKIEA